MDFGDYKKQGSVPPTLLNSRGNGDNDSAEDLAWADSCLIGDPEISEGGLYSFRNVFSLLDIQSSQLRSPVDEKGEFREAADKKISLFGGKGRSSTTLDKTTTCNPPGKEQAKGNRIGYDKIRLSNEQEGNMIDYYPISLSNEEGNMVDYYPFSLSNEQEGNMIDYEQISNEQDGNIIDSHQTNESTDTFSSKFDSENVFLPTYNENQRIFITDDPEMDSIFPAFLEDLPAENIFKVWELDIPDDEDELIEQVKEAIAEHSLEPIALVSDDLQLLRGLNDQSLDDLISGIADMSLSR